MSKRRERQSNLPPAAESVATASKKPDIKDTRQDGFAPPPPDEKVVENVTPVDDTGETGDAGTQGVPPAAAPATEQAVQTAPVEVAPVVNDAALERALASNRALRRQLDKAEEARERSESEREEVDTGEGTIPEREYFFRGLAGTIVLSTGTSRWDQQLNRLVTDKPAIYAQFNGGLWKTTSQYESMLMERHPAFKNGKCKNVSVVKLNRRKALEAQLATMDEAGNTIGPAPAIADATFGHGPRVGTAGFAEAAKSHGDFTMPQMHVPAEVPILKRGAVSGNRETR